MTNDELQVELAEAYSGLHELVLSDVELMWLMGHTAYEDGIGAGLYMKFRALARRDAVILNPPITTDRIAEIVADRAEVTWR